MVGISLPGHEHRRTPRSPPGGFGSERRLPAERSTSSRRHHARRLAFGHDIRLHPGAPAAWREAVITVSALPGCRSAVKAGQLQLVPSFISNGNSKLQV